MASSAPAIGIDLGTTFSCVAALKPGQLTPSVIVNHEGSHTTPSIAAFRPGRAPAIADSHPFIEPIVGKAADDGGTVPENVIYDSKRLIGRRLNDQTVQEDKRSWPFKVVADPSTSEPVYEMNVGGEIVRRSPVDIGAAILGKLKDAASKSLGAKVTKAVITCPAYFNDAQREATKQSGERAGLEVLRILNEPTAAAIAYGFQSGPKGMRKTVMVYDLGGGTLDVTIMKILNGSFEVISTSGDTHLGGQDFTNALLKFAIDEYTRETGSAPTSKTHRKLRRASEDAKILLNAREVYQAGIEGDNDFFIEVTRSKFESLCEPHFARCLKPVEIALRDAHLGKGEIDEVILAGGATRMVRVRSMLSGFFNGKELRETINPDHAIAEGAAIVAAVLTGVRNDFIQDFNFQFHDVTPLSLGLRLYHGDFCVLIPKNTRYPCERTRSDFSTPLDNMTSISIQIYEGEDQVAANNALLGMFSLSGFPAKPAGEVSFKITFRITEDGILTVTAVEGNSGANNSLRVVKTRLPDR